MTTDNLHLDPGIQFKVTLKNCEDEPIHIPGSIQPHGVLFALDDESVIRKVSANIEEHLQLRPEQVLGKPLGDILPEEPIRNLFRCLTQWNGNEFDPEEVELEVNGSKKCFHLFCHAQDHFQIFELECVQEGYKRPYQISRLISNSMQRAEKSESLQEVCDTVVKDIKSITGYDRVMIYKFDREGNGEVMAEAREEHLEPFLHLHYPASDIPPQARRLYKRNLMRLIPDVNYQPVPIYQLEQPEQSEPLYLGQSLLRSVSPIHIEYLQNMGVGGTLVISIIVNDELWGLITCHHYSPHWISHEVRLAARIMGMFLSSQIPLRESKQVLEEESLANKQAQQVVLKVRGWDTLLEAFANSEDTMNMVQATGAAIFLSPSRGVSVGDAPPQARVAQLVNDLKPHLKNGTFHTYRLGLDFPQFKDLKEVASGVMMIALKPVGGYLLWFRPEVRQTVNWAGDPNDAVKVSASGQLSPRNSFAQWKEVVRLKAAAWEPHHVEAAETLVKDIRNLLNVKNLQVEKETHQQTSRQLERSNKELNDFAYVVSHDLKAPLRGIGTIAEFLHRDYAEKLDEEGQLYINKLIERVKRMYKLIDGILQYSRVGRLQEEVKRVDLHEVVEEIIQFVSPPPNFSMQIVSRLPSLYLDEARIAQVFQNLLDNAIKFNDKEYGEIEIDCSKKGDTFLFAVSDNGMGIDERWHSNIFQIFQTLSSTKDSENTGIGLPLVKKIISQYGGQVWLKSQPEVGTVFYFTLPASLAEEAQAEQDVR